MIAGRVVAPLATPTFAAADDDRAQLGQAERRLHGLVHSEIGIIVPSEPPGQQQIGNGPAE